MKCYNENKESLVKMINSQRENDGISVRALSQIAECNQSGLNQVLNKEYPTTLDLLCSLLNGLGYTVTMQIKHAASGEETNIRLRK